MRCGWASLSLERNDSSSSGNGIERAAGAASLLGFTVSWSWRLRWLSIDPIKMHAHQNLLVTHFLKPLQDHPNCRTPHSQSGDAIYYFGAVCHRSSNLADLHMFRMFDAPAARMISNGRYERRITDVREALRG